MVFEDRDEYIQAQASEKITLAQVEASTRLVSWTLDSGSIYKKTVNYYVVGLKQGQTTLTEASSSAVAAGEFYYDPAAGEVYVQTTGSTDPNNEELIVTYRFFYSDAPITASHDLANDGIHVHYQGRIKSSPGYKHKIGVEQKLVSTIGSGNLVLDNNDAELDEIFDTLFFENKECRIYSWNRDLNFSEAKIIFRGKVTNKKYTSDTVSFTVKDSIFDLLQNVPQSFYTDDDNVNDDIKGRVKRWVYGRVDGLKVQSTDQIGSGYGITGELSGDTTSATITGTTTSFLSELSPGDQITIGTQEFQIESIASDTSLTVDNAPEFAFTAQSGTVVPEVPTTSKNREFFVAGHATAKLTKTVVEVKQFNRVVLNDTVGLEPGDFVEFATAERIEIKNVAPGNIIVLQQNMVTLPAVSSSVTRQPIQEVFVEGNKIASEDFTISNIGGSTNETKVTLDSDTEFNIARLVSFGFDATFTNGSRSVTTTDDIDLREILSPRDWIRPTDLSFTTFYEILSVSEQSLELRTNFTDPNHTGATQGKRPNYIGDSTVVSANVLGKTKDGEPDGDWIFTAAACVRDLLSELNITNINETSFTQGEIDNQETISLALPLTPTASSVTTKSVIDLLAKSTVSSVTLDPDLNLKFKVLLPEIDENASTIRDEDVINWSIQTTNGETIRNSIIKYRFQDIDRATLEAGNLAQSYSSDFVRDYIGTNRSNELDVYLYNIRSARIMAHRDVYYRSLGRADVKITTDLRLENIEIGDQVILDFDRLYKRLGDDTSRKKVCVVVGKTVTGSRVNIELTDLGNIFNRSTIITPNTAADFSAATEDEKLKFGYITDTSGIVDNDDNTANVNLIS